MSVMKFGMPLAIDFGVVPDAVCHQLVMPNLGMARMAGYDMNVSGNGVSAMVLIAGSGLGGWCGEYAGDNKQRSEEQDCDRKTRVAHRIAPDIFLPKRGAR